MKMFMNIGDQASMTLEKICFPNSYEKVSLAKHIIHAVRANSLGALGALSGPPDFSAIINPTRILRISRYIHL